MKSEKYGLKLNTLKKKTKTKIMVSGPIMANRKETWNQ